MSEPDHPPMAGAAVQHLVESLTAEGRDVRAAVDALTVATEAEGRARRRWNRLIASLVAVATLLVVMLTVIVVQNRSRSIQSGEILRRNAQISEQIADCTTTGGTCSQESARRTGAAIDELSRRLARVQIYVAECARTTDTDPALERCVALKLANPARPAPGPSPTS